MSEHTEASRSVGDLARLAARGAHPRGAGMLSLSTGTDTAYLTDTVAAGREGYYTGAVDAGGPPGVWYGAGAAALCLSGEVDAELMTAIYAKGLDPRDPQARDKETWEQAARLGAAPKTYRSANKIYRELLAAEPVKTPEVKVQLKLEAERLAKHPVAYVDATFSAPKSLSIAYAAFSRAANEALAAGRYADAALWSQRVCDVERAVIDGARASIDFLQERAGYGRIGHHGKTQDGTNSGRWIDAHTFVVGMFLQHDSRAGDPQLHVHCAILNKQLCADGQWRALDTRAIHRWRGGAAAVGERTMEASAFQSLGLRWWDRPDGNGRELVGVSQEIIDLYSSRERAVSTLAGRWQAEWEQQQGRPCPSRVRHAFRQAAALQTRARKSKTPPTAEQQSQMWGAKFAQQVGEELTQLADRIVAEATAHQGEAVSWSMAEVIERTLTRLEAKQAMWSYSDVLRAVSSELPANLGGRPDRVKDLLIDAADAVWDASVALNDHEPTTGLPPEMLLADGRSSYQSPAGQMRTSATILAAEQALREAVTATGARAVTAEQADAAIAHAMTGRTLGADQLAFIRGALTSESQIVHLVAPAGTGKSYAIGALADAWTASGGRVFGTATSQIATEVLTQDGLNAMNITQWLKRGEPLQPNDLVVLDESSMTPTAQLLAVQQRCAAAGAKLVFAGDPYQLGAVGGSSLAHDLPKRGERFELAEVRRFTAEWEKAASLGLRQGDPRALEAYAAHGRIIDGGTLEQAQRILVRNYLADRAAGLDTVLVAQTNEQAAQLSALVRAYLVDNGQVDEHGVPIAGDNIAGIGDVIEARRNGWHLLGYLGNTSVPINKTTYTVVGTRADGGLIVTDQRGQTLTLPGDYVRDNVVLGYGRTAYSVEGLTCQTVWGLATEHTRRQDLYVTLSRGQRANHAVVVTRAEVPDAPTGEVAQTPRRDARAVLADVLAGSPDHGAEFASPSLYNDHQTDIQRSLLRSLDRLGVEVDLATVGRTAAILDSLTEQGALTIEQRAQLAGDPRGLGELDRRLRQAELAGHDVEQVLLHAVTERELDDVRDVGRLLAARVCTDLRSRLQPQIGSAIDLVPPALRTNPRFMELAEAADARFAELGARAVEEQPRWLTEHLGPVPDNVWERLEYERRAGWIAGYRELAGHDDERAPIGAPPRHDSAHHRALWQIAHQAFGQPSTGPAEGDMTDAQLRAAVDRWRREEAVQPAYVADELEAAHHAERENRVNAALWETAAQRADHAQRQVLSADARRARDAAATAAARIPGLERKAHYRAQWYAATAEVRDAAARALSEANVRGVNFDDGAADVPGVRAAVDTTHDVVTDAVASAVQLAATEQHHAEQQALTDVSGAHYDVYSETAAGKDLSDCEF